MYVSVYFTFRTILYFYESQTFSWMLNTTLCITWMCNVNFYVHMYAFSFNIILILTLHKYYISILQNWKQFHIKLCCQFDVFAYMFSITLNGLLFTRIMTSTMLILYFISNIKTICWKYSFRETLQSKNMHKNER